MIAAQIAIPEEVCDVRSGSKPEVSSHRLDVCSSPKNGHRRIPPRCPKSATSGHWRPYSIAHLHLAISSSENFLAEARGFLNVENGVSLAIFFESSANGIERIVAMGWLAAFIEQGEMGQGEFFLVLRPKEWCVLAGPFLQRLMKGNDGLLQPGRPFLALAEDQQRGAQTGFGKSPVEWRAVAGLFLQRPPVGNDRLLQPSRSALTRSDSSKRIAEP